MLVYKFTKILTAQIEIKKTPSGASTCGLAPDDIYLLRKSR
jgi:hypothetical protein